jgi:hypothetical protein
MTGRANNIRLSAYWDAFTACVRVLISLVLLSALPLLATAQSKTILTIYSDERLMPSNIRVKPFENVTLAIHVAPFDM